MNTRNSRIFIFLAISILLMVAAGLFLRPETNAASAVMQDTPTPITYEPVSSEQTVIAGYQNLLEGGELDAQMEASIQEKLEIAQRIEEQREASIQSGQLGSAQGIEGYQSQQDPEFQTGIFEGGEGMFRPQEAIIENYWQAQVGELYIQVFAGASGMDASQGVVYVVTTAKDRMKTEIERYETLEKNGSLKIEAEMEDLRLLLSSESGENYMFDIRGRIFE